MAFKCENCEREFNTEQGLGQHKRDKHGEKSHDIKEMKRKAKEEWKEVEKKKAQGEKQRKSMLTIAAVSLVVLVIGYFALTYKPATPISGTYNLSGIPQGFVHWHADVDVFICGEDKALPYGPVGSLLGTHRMHTHDRSANLASLPGSDGNGVMHNEGTIPSTPAEHTLGKFMKNIGTKFSKTEIMDKKNGDTCGEKEGTVKVFLNDNLLDDPENYLPRDRDFIRIEFG